MNQTLEVLIKASAETATGAINKLKKSLGDFKAGFEETGKEVANFSNVMFTLGKLSLAGLITGVAKLATSLRASIDRAEELNLFNVVFKNIGKTGEETFSELGEAATKFQNKLNETFGTNKTDTLRYQALFQSMGENTGIKDKYAAIMSENLTKLTYDIASLYNTSEKSVAEALKSGIYAGQTKPMRKYGVDVTQGSLSPLLQQLGIDDRTISQMSQAEKQILRYIATMRQAQVAMGDFADTIESPANQLKVLKNQFIELKTAVGNLFVGMLAQILPYANAILMVLKEIAKAIADFFGIKVSDYNSGLSAIEDTGDYLDGVGSSADKATKAVKGLNRQVLKFDQINNIKSPTKSGSGSSGGSGGVSGGIDKRLLESLKGYDNLMDKVKMKATEIRDRWMDILGFKKVINPLTGEVSFKYQGFSKTVEGLAKWFGNLSSKAKLFVGLGVAVTLGHIYSKAKALLGIVGGTGLAKSFKDFGLALTGTFGSGNSGIINGFSKSINKWREQKGIIGENVSTLKKFTNGLGEFVKGAAIAGGSFLILNTGLEDMKQNGINVINSLETLGGVLGTTFGAAQMLAVFGPWGAAIGGGIGLIVSLVKAISGISEALDEEQRELDALSKQAEEDYQKMVDGVEKYREAINNVDSELGYYEKLKEELDGIVDKNGKIKEGYEDRAKVITGILADAFGVEIQIVDGVIVKYGDLEQKIEDVMQQKRAMAKMEILEDKWKTAVQNLDSAEEKLDGTYQKKKKLIQEQDEMVQKLCEKYGLEEETIRKMIPSYSTMKFEMGEVLDAHEGLEEELGKLRPHYNTLTNQIKDATESWEKQKEVVEDNEHTIKIYEQAYGYVMDKNYEALDDYMKKEAKSILKSKAERDSYYVSLENKAREHKKYMLEHQDEYIRDKNGKIDKEKQEEFNKLLAADERIIKHADEYFDNYKQIWTDGNNEITKETVKQWQELGKKSTEECIKEFKKLPKDIQDELYDKMVNTGEGITEELKKGLEKEKLTKTIEIKAKDNATSTIKGIIGNLSKSFPDLGKLLSGKAKGGVYTARGWSNIPQYANGGSPTHGTLFAAGENGAEVVGNINRRTEVLNRSQLASVMYTAVSNALSNANFGGDINVYAHTDEGVVIDRINRKTKQTGVCPIKLLG